jgi:hypothetical protein
MNFNMLKPPQVARPALKTQKIAVNAAGSRPGAPHGGAAVGYPGGSGQADHRPALLSKAWGLTPGVASGCARCSGADEKAQEKHFAAEAGVAKPAGRRGHGGPWSVRVVAEARGWHTPATKSGGSEAQQQILAAAVATGALGASALCCCRAGLWRGSWAVTRAARAPARTRTHTRPQFLCPALAATCSVCLTGLSACTSP